MPPEPNDGGPAFPCTKKERVPTLTGKPGTYEVCTVHYPGMSRRQLYAGLALTGTMANTEELYHGATSRLDCARNMWDWADAVLATEHPQPPAQQPETVAEATISPPAAETTSETEGGHVGD